MVNSTLYFNCPVERMFTWGLAPALLAKGRHTGGLTSNTKQNLLAVSSIPRRWSIVFCSEGLSSTEHSCACSGYLFCGLLSPPRAAGITSVSLHPFMLHETKRSSTPFNRPFPPQCSLICSFKIEISQSITLKSSKRGGGKWGDKGGDLTTVLILCILHFPHLHLGQIFSCKTKVWWNYFCINSGENIALTVCIWRCCSAILTLFS